MYLNEVKNYDEVRRAFFKMGRYKPLPPQSAERKTISKVARFTNEPEDVATLYYIPHFLETRMMHYWGIHCLLTLNELPEFFDTLDYVNDGAYHHGNLIKQDWFATLPQFMHVKAAVRYGLYNTPVVRRPPLALSRFEKESNILKLLGGDFPFEVKSSDDGLNRSYTVKLPKVRRDHRWC